MKESKFQSDLIKEIKERFEGAIVLKNDPSHIQGIPDLTILYKDKWAALECKKKESAKRQPNQTYYVDQLRTMSYASFIFPENKEAVLDELQQAFTSRRKTCISEPK